MNAPLECGNWIGGQWRKGAAHFENRNPSDTRECLSVHALASAADVQDAVDAARDAQRAWARATPQQRADVLFAAGHEILSRREELGRLLSAEEGKVLAEGVAEVTRAGQIFRYFAGEALRLSGQTGDSVRPGIRAESLLEPVGVVGLITPWNFPLAIPAWKLAPALAFGNAALLKPSELAPLSAWMLVQILERAGLPPGVFNLLCGDAHTGRALVDARGLDALSFTGSLPTGAAIAASAAPRFLRLQLEMGGKNPLVVLDDADLDTAVNCAVNGAYYSTGQRCTASSRLIVTPGIHDRFRDALLARLRTLRIGHALQADSDIGPVVDARQMEKNQHYLRIGCDEGATLAFGGEPLSRPTPGHFMAPALFTDTTPQMRINREEIFGPVACLLRARDDEHALELAHDTEFGLCAGLVSTSLRHAEDFRRRVQAGVVMINLPTAGLDYHVPFGGRRRSSYGPREQGEAARAFYTQGKTAYISA